jgi:DNA polymerase-3 subunit alpha
MSKKKHAVMEAEREHFVHGCTEPGHECKGCVANGISEKVANEIYDEMSSFASYAFNKSHAACYAYVAYQTAYLKCHYPSEFMAALLTSVLDNTDKVIEYSGECGRLGIKVLPPDINISNGGFTSSEGTIRFGLNAVKNVGRNLIDNVVAARAEKPYASLYDFCKRMRGNELNRRAVESLIKAGAFDSLGVNRRSLIEAVEGILKSIESDARHNLDGQIDLFSCMGMGDAADAPEQDTYEVKPLPEYSTMELLQMEKEVSGLYLSGHPLDAYRDQTRRFATHSIKALTGEDAAGLDNTGVRIVCTIVKSRMMTTKSNSVMAFTSVEDLTGTMEVIVFPRVLDNYRAALQDNAVVVIEGRLSVREDEPAKLMAEWIVPVEQYNPGDAPARGGAGRGGAPRQNEAQPRLYIRLPSKSSVQYDKVLNLLELFDGGKMPVVLYLEDTKQKLGVPNRLYTTGHPLLLAELERLLGKENVATK